MIKKRLEERGYVYRPDDRLWTRPGYTGLAYSDGDEAENRLAGLVAAAADRSVMSGELQRLIADWPSRYHLSQLRANLLRPFREALTGRTVLEIGAGLGALTRYLGETGAETLALEGSPRRAAIAAARTRDLPNVTVVCDDFRAFQVSEPFEVVTMVGVLEYAPLFFEGDNPALRMLEQVRACLKPDGWLLLAIENQLGLKYFCGAAEDHIGRPMYGLENLYTDTQPRTFGRRELDELLAEAGFGGREFFAPFPDYKFPAAIISEEGALSQLFRASDLAVSSLHGDLQRPPCPTFRPELVWPLIARNGLMIHLANSFLIRAGHVKSSPFAPGTLAWHYGAASRRACFSKELRFLSLADDAIIIQSQAFTDSTAPPGDNLNFILPEENRPYVYGLPLESSMMRLLTTDGWRADDFLTLLRRYLHICELYAADLGQAVSLDRHNARLPNVCFDLIPRNIIMLPGGGFKVIDIEWSYRPILTGGYLLFRGLMSLVNTIPYFGHCADRHIQTLFDFFTLGFQVFDELPDRGLLTGYLQREERVKDEITNGAHVKLEPSFLDAPLPHRLTNPLGSAPSGGDLPKLTCIGRLWRFLQRRSWREDRFWLRLISSLRRVYRLIPLPVAVRRRVSLAAFRLLNRRLFSRKRKPTFTFPKTRPAPRSDRLPDYVVFGISEWFFRHQRPQHLASRLAASGRRVFFVSSELLGWNEAGFHVERLDDAGRLFQVALYGGTCPFIHNQAPDDITAGRLRASVGQLLAWADIRGQISLVEHPFWLKVAESLPNNRLIYDCMDHMAGFCHDAREISVLEQSLFAAADLTVVSSTFLDEAAAKLTSRRALIRNACQYEHFARRPPEVYRDARNRKIIGYYGAIADWFDQDMVEAVAHRFPDCLILLIGEDSARAGRRLGKLPNVEFTGEKPYADLPYYLHGFDVCLLPFRILPLTLATNPLKIYEYLAAGKPVVSVDLPEIRQFEGLVEAAADLGGFLEALAETLARPVADEEVSRRRVFARQQTWEHRVQDFIEHVETRAVEPPVSVVVVAYNNLELTQACLRSLDQYSDYPPLEIVVVDNASTDGSRGFLADWAENAPNRKLILNDDNLGFAAANNQGLAIAAGEYLTLLNNDTYVTPGWVRTLARHLRRDPSIGLIGPVTNNIGNEARLDISYSGMEEMLEKSASHTLAHIGQTRPLRTVAFFCVMMSREIYRQVGPLDESFGLGFFEDDDYCRRVERLGRRVVCAEDVFVHHRLSASFDQMRREDRQRLFEENRRRYEAKWGTWTPHSHRGR